MPMWSTRFYLNYEENLEQIKGTEVELITLSGGHMSSIESQAELPTVLADFSKESKAFLLSNILFLLVLL